LTELLANQVNEMSMDFIVGGVARDDDFFFHKAFLDDLIDSLRTDHVLLIAPRRTGKTSVMFKLRDKPPENRLVIHLNVEELSTPAEFFISLLDAIHEQQPDFLREHLAKTWDIVKKAGNKLEEVSYLDFKIKLKQSADWEKDWGELAEQLMKRLVKSNQPMLFIIDELPDMLISMQEQSADLKAFLHCFRAMRQTSKNKHIRWLVGGSVNIRGTLEDSGFINLINDFRIEVLPSLSDKEVTEFIQTMFQQKGITYSDDVIPEIHVVLGVPIALFLQLLTQELYRYWRRENPDQLTAEHVQQVFNQALLGEAAHDKLQHFHSRIRLHYSGADQEAAYVLLNQLSQSDAHGIREATLFQQYAQLETKKTTAKTGEVLKQAFKKLLVQLQSDFYIQTADNGNLNFNSHLLKLWWRKHWAYDYA
jgi:hypothetical protein